MFGSIAAAGADRLAYAAFDGTVVFFDVVDAEVCGQFTVFPSGPETSHVSACAYGHGALWIGDARHGRVRRFSEEGRQLGVVGGLPTPGIEEQDDAGIVAQPCAIRIAGESVLVACGGLAAEHGVQRFAVADGAYQGSFVAPEDGWQRAQGLAVVGDAVWVAETEAGLIRRRGRDGSERDDVELHPDLRRPFRLEADGYGGVLMTLAPEDADQHDLYGVARLDGEGAFVGWAVPPGEEPGQAYCAFDIAVFSDGRFVVADLPLGGPPEVRLQLFGSDGRLVDVLAADTVDLRNSQYAWFQRVLARPAKDADTAYEQARAHHLYGGGSEQALAEGRRLYRAALTTEPGHALAGLGLAALLQQTGEHAAAEQAFRAVLATGGAETSTVLPRIAMCRHAAGDLDGAIAALQEAIEATKLPDGYHEWVETLGTWYLERSGETS